MSRRIMEKIYILCVLTICFLAVNKARASGFDQGVAGSSSALSQMEGISGQHISRPPLIRSHVPGGSGTAAAISSGNSSAMAAFTTGMMIFQLLDAIDSGQQQQTDLARVQAEAKRKRRIEEQRLRVQRSVLANRLRDNWDRRDREMTTSLAGAFDLPGKGPGTNFFGTVPASDADPNAIGKSDGRGKAANTIPILGTGAPNVPMPYTWEPSPIQENILRNGPVSTQGSAFDLLKGAAEDAITGRRRNLKMAIDHVAQVKEFTAKLFQVIEPQRLVGALVNGSAADYNALLTSIDRVTQQAADLNEVTGLENRILKNPRDAGRVVRGYITNKYLAKILSGSMRF